MEVPKKRGDCESIHCPNCVYYGTNNCVDFKEELGREVMYELTPEKIQSIYNKTYYTPGLFGSDLSRYMMKETAKAQLAKVLRLQSLTDVQLREEIIEIFGCSDCVALQECLTDKPMNFCTEERDHLRQICALFTAREQEAVRKERERIIKELKENNPFVGYVDAVENIRMAKEQGWDRAWQSLTVEGVNNG